MRFRDGMRKGRSHLIFAAVLAGAGSLVVHIEDDTLHRETGRAPPAHPKLPLSPVPGPLPKDVPAEPPRSVPGGPAVNPAPQPPTPSVAATYVQIGAYGSRLAAERQGQRALQYLGKPPGLAPHVEPFGAIFRARLGPVEPARAQALCDRLVAKSYACLPVTRPRR